MTAKNRNFSAIVLAGLIGLLAHNASAQTWQTVDDFVSGSFSYARAACTDPFGNIYVAGAAENPGSPNNSAAVVRKSSDGGNTWTSVDFFFTDTAPGQDYWWEYHGIASDSAGTLYVVGEKDFTTWIVRRSLDSGATWETVDLSLGEAMAVTTDASGNVYVAGNSGGIAGSWITRKSASGGAAGSWVTVDSLANSRALGILSHPTAGLFAVGNGTVTTTGKGNKTTSQRYSYVRRSMDGGTTWTTVDTVVGNGTARNIRADNNNNIYVVGDNGSQWMLRKSVNGGSSFASVGNFTCVTTSTKPLRTECASGFATDLATDAFGNLFAVGNFGSVGYGYTYAWGVRKSAGGVGNWQTVDLLPNPSPYQSVNQSAAWGTVTDQSGNVFVVGWTHAGEHWVVRKLSAQP